MDWSCLVPSLVPDTRHYPGRGTKGRLNNPSSMAHLEGNSESGSDGHSRAPVPRTWERRRIRSRSTCEGGAAEAATAVGRAIAAVKPRAAHSQPPEDYARDSWGPWSPPLPEDKAKDKAKAPLPKQRGLHTGISRRSAVSDYLMILVTRPEPTVRPPSRMAKPRPSSMAMGWISSTLISVLSPGMTISVPSGRVITPVTSVVRK